jgi:hypothetical protein
MLTFMLAAHVVLASSTPAQPEPPTVVVDVRVIQLGADREFPGAADEGQGMTIVGTVIEPNGMPYRSGALSVVQDFDADRAIWFDENGNPSLMSDRTFTGSVQVYTVRSAAGAIKTLGAEYVVSRDWSPAPDAAEQHGFRTALAPKIVTSSGQRASIRVASDVQWMEPNPDGSFSVKTGEEETEGITIALTPRVEGGLTRSDDITIEFREVARREPVEGVNLAIGRPVFRSSLVRTNAEWQGDNVVIVPLQPLTERSGLIYVLIRAEVAE